MDSKDIFLAFQKGEISYENAEKELKKIINDAENKSTNIDSLEFSKNSSTGDDKSFYKVNNEVKISKKQSVNSVISLCEVEDGIIQITMEDVENKNTFSQELVTGLMEAFKVINGNLNYKVIILTGYGNYFASGGTKEGLLAIQEGKVKFTDIEIYNIALECKLPVIAAMQGHGIGAGWAMGMFCDFVVMSEESYYSSNYIKYGFTPGAGATLIFPEKFGRNLAQEILYTGKSFRGKDLAGKGISFPVLPRSEVVKYSIEFAKELAEAPREALIALKELMTKSIKEKLLNTYENELKMHEKTFVNKPDVKKRIEAAFITSSQNDRIKEPLNIINGHSNYSSENNNEKKTKSCKDDSDNAIAIIGMAGQFPKAKNLEEYWYNISNAKDCISEVPESRWSISDYYNPDPKAARKSYSKWMGVLEDGDKFDPLFFNISPAEAEVMDPQQRLFLESCWHCIEDAALKPSMLSKSRCGVFVGCASGNYFQYIDENKLNAQSFMGAATSILSARISFLLNLKGPSMAIDTACSSSLVAIAQACDSLILGNCDLALAGGVCVTVGPLMHITTSKAGMLSTEGKCYTFDSNADGFVPGEGTGVVLLKRLSDAISDGDQIHGVIRGWGLNQDGKTNGITAPSVNSQMLLQQDVYKRFNINPKTISLVEAHGTATKLGDPIEVEALTESFKAYTNNKNYCALGSVKSNIGHLLTASGIASIIKVLLSLKHKMLPPSINFKKLNEHISLENSPFYINTKLQPWVVNNGMLRCAAINAFGFSGTNAHIVIEEYNPDNYRNIIQEKNKIKINNSVAFILSTKNKEQLLDYALTMKNWIINNKELDINDLTYTLQVGREDMNYRLAFVADSRMEILERLDEFIFSNQSENILATHIKKKIDYHNVNEKDEYMRLLSEINIQKDKLKKAIELWSNGIEIDWDKVHDFKHKRISLPGYPFAKERYWISQPKRKDEITSSEVCYIETGNSAERLSKEHKFSNLDFGDELSFARSYVVNILTSVLKINIEKLDIDTNFDEFGIDSIVVQELNKILFEDFGDIPATIFFTYKNIKMLSEYLVKEHRETIRLLLKNSRYNLVKKDNKNKTEYEKQENEVQKYCGKTKNQNITKDTNNDIAIIGISGVYPKAQNIGEFWSNLERGMDCIVEIPKNRWDYHRYYDSKEAGSKKSGGMYCKWGGFIDDFDKFDPSFFNISPIEARFMDPQERLFLQTTSSCFEDAGYSRRKLRDDSTSDGAASVGVFVGVTYNNYQLNLLKEFDKGSFAPINSQTYSIANRVSYCFNLRGPSVSLDTACSSSLYAIHLACQSIKTGECEMAVAGGVNLSLHSSKYMALCVGQFAASDGRCHSFGEYGDGYVPGEGVGVVLLKLLDKAIADGDNIHAIIKGSAANNDGKTFGYRVPNPVAQTEVIQKALEVAGVNSSTISYVEAHGTGTKLGDPIEIEGLKNAFEQYTSDKQFCSIGSVKSNIGHLESAAGIAQLTKVVLQMKKKKLVKSLIHSDKLNSNINFSDTPFFVQQSLEKWKQPIIKIDGEEKVYPRRAGISSFGAGGVNVHMIVEEYENEVNIENIDDKDDNQVVIVLSAKAEDNLRTYAKEIKEYLEKNNSCGNKKEKLMDIAYTLQVGRDSMPFRLAFTAYNILEVINKLEVFINKSAENSSIYFNNIVSSINSANEIEKNSYMKLDGKYDLNSLAQLWVQGKEIEWSKLYENCMTNIISLPTYPFTKESYWFEDVQEEIAFPNNIDTKNEVETEETSTLVDQLHNTLEDERQEILEKYLQKVVADLLAFNSSKLPEINQGFFDMGMESVMTAKFHMLIEKGLGVNISETAIFDHSSIEQLSKYLLSIVSFSDLESKDISSNKDREEASLSKKSFDDISNAVIDVDSMSLEEAANELKNLLD